MSRCIDCPCSDVERGTSRSVLRWYLIYTKPAAEGIAQVNLERQGYAIYLPLLVLSVLARKRRRERIVPLFPRYLFLGLWEGQQTLAPVRSSMGVCNVVRFGHRYAVVADETIEHLRMCADPVTGLHRLADAPPLISGTAVRVASGPFDGLEGIFHRDDGAERVIVLLNLLGQETAVRLPAEWIMASDDVASARAA